jgi:hypothetical protein
MRLTIRRKTSMLAKKLVRLDINAAVSSGVSRAFADVLGQERQQFESLPAAAQSDSKVPVNLNTQTESPRSVLREDRDYEAGFGGQEDLEDRYATTSGEH